MANDINKTKARHTEIKRRYAWQARQRRKRSDGKPDHARLITLIRLRELERLFQSRYGRFLPQDDSGLDDLILAAHHIALLGGNVTEHIVGWARAWAPGVSQNQAEQLAGQVAADPRKFTADALAWRLRLSMAERTALRITTIGAFDMSKVERAEERRRKDREAKRAKRAKNSSGRPRGRPKKMAQINASAAVRESIAVDGFSANAHAARKVLENAPALNPSQKPKTLKAIQTKEEVCLGKTSPAKPINATARAALPQVSTPVAPPSGAIDQARALASQHTTYVPANRQAILRMLERFWPGYVRGKISTAIKYYGSFKPDRDLRSWAFAFRNVLDGEAAAIERYRDRRRKWKRNHPTRPTPGSK